MRMMSIGLRFVIMIRWFNLMNSSSDSFKYVGFNLRFASVALTQPILLLWLSHHGVAAIVSQPWERFDTAPSRREGFAKGLSWAARRCEGALISAQARLQRSGAPPRLRDPHELRALSGTLEER